MRGSGRSAPRVQSWVEPEAGWTRSRPSSSASPTASGTTGQHRLGAHVDLDAADDAGPELAADVGRAFEQEHGEPGTAELTSSGQAGETAADHHDIG